jgi:hypothetical protein
MFLSLLLIVLWLALGLFFAGIYISFVSATAAPIRTFAVGLTITACVYVLFALLHGASFGWFVVELLGVAVYGVLALLGVQQKKSWLALGWLLHPIWDVALHCFGSGAAHAPAWYAVACVSFDVLVAAYIYNSEE